MADQLKVEEILKRRKEATEKLEELQQISRNSLDETAKQQEVINSIDAELDELRNPNNPLLRVLSRASEKAGNVIRNVRLSILSEEELKKEYEIYKRVNDSLGKESVAFDTFKVTPEDFIEKNSKPTTLRKVEDSLKETTTNLNQTLKEVVEASEKKLDQASVAVESVVDKAKPKVSSLTSFLGKSFSGLGQQVKDIVATTITEYKKAEAELEAEKNNSEVKVKEPVQPTSTQPVKTEKSEVSSPVVESQTSTPAKKVAVKKTVDNKTLVARKKLFQEYKKKIDKETVSGTKPEYTFARYKEYTVEVAAPKEHVLAAATFKKAVSALEVVEAPVKTVRKPRKP